MGTIGCPLSAKLAYSWGLGQLIDNTHTGFSVYPAQGDLRLQGLPPQLKKKQGVSLSGLLSESWTLYVRTTENDTEIENQENSEFNRGGHAPRTCLLGRIGDPWDITKQVHRFFRHSSAG